MTGAALAAARGLYFAATMLLFGAACFAALLRARLPVIAPLRLGALRWGALALAIIAGGAWLVLAAMQMAGAMDRGILAVTTTATLFGQLFLVRMAVLLALGIVFATRRGWRMPALLAAVALVLPAVTGHAAQSSPAHFTAIGATVDGIHLLTAGFWIGGLAVLVALHARREPNLLLALSLFSDWALVAVMLLVMTGLLNAASVLLGMPGHVSPFYSAVLCAKLALVAGMLVLAAINRFRLTQKGDNKAIARNATIELAAGLAVVLLAGALGQMQPTL